MGAEMDRLEVQVEAQAAKANAELNKLVGKLNEVANSLRGINSSGLTGLAAGVQKFAQASAHLGNVKTADFTRLAKNIQSISSLNTAQIQHAASAMGTLARSMNNISSASTNSIQIAQVARDISKLGGKNVQRAITNLPALAIELKKLIATLDSAPRISSNTVRLTNALAKLASQGSKVGTATRSLSSHFNNYSRSASRAIKTTTSLAAKIGKLYASYFWVSRGVRALGKAIETSMDYVETYNYFNVTMDKIAKENKKMFAQYGYGSAEEYASSFENRLNELTQKMSGYSIAENGELSLTESIGLGLDPEAIMNYQASIGAVTNSVGLVGEISVNAAKALSMLAADMSSLKNVDLKTVMTNFQSGLIGQSRALYKYGIDITNATLQTYAYKYGINMAVSEMTQASKMQLRLLAILDQSKIAWGDQANTINSVANQYRILKQQFANLTRAIGNLFLPIAQKILPVINGMVIACQRLVIWLGNLLGVDMSKVMGNINGGSSDFEAEDGMSDIEDSANDATDSIDDTAKALKELKNATTGIDELNIIQQQEPNAGGDSGGSGSGGGVGSDIDLSGAIADALADYESIWAKAFEESENLAQGYADSICKAFSEAWATGDFTDIGSAVSSKITSVLESIDWQKVYSAAKGFGKGFATFLNGLITPELFGEVGKTIAGALNTKINASFSFAENFNWENLGNSIASGINNFFSTFDFGLLAKTLNTWVDGVKTAIVTAVENINWASVWDGIRRFLSELEVDTLLVLIGGLALKFKKGSLLLLLGEKLGKMLSGGITLNSLILRISSIVLWKGTPAFDMIGNFILDKISEVVASILPNWAFEFLSKLGAGVALGAVAGSWFSGAGTVAGAIIGGILGALDGIVIDGKSILKKIVDKIFNWDATMAIFEDAKKNFEKGGLYIILGIGEGLLAAIGFLIEPIGDFFAGFFEAICDVFGIHSPAETMKPVGEYISSGILEGFKNAWTVFVEFLSTLPQEIIDTFDGVKKGLGEKFQSAYDKVIEIFKNIGSWFGQRWQEIQEALKDVAGWFQVKFGDAYTNIQQAFQFIGSWFRGRWNDIVNVFKGVATWFQTKFNAAYNNITGVFKNIGSWFGQRWTDITNAFKDTITWFKSKFGDAWEGIKEKFSKSNVTVWFGDRWSDIQSKFTAGKNAVDTWFGNKFETAWKEIKKVFNDKDLKAFFGEDGVWGKIKGAFGSLYETGKELVSTLISGFKSLEFPKLKIDVTYNPDGFAADVFKALGFEGTPNLSWSFYESGGFPNTGEAFIARENGIPEMVGRIGNRTTVANNDQIVEAVSQGVANAIASVLNSTNSNNSAYEIINTTVNLDGRVIVKQTDKVRRNNGYNFNPI